MDKSPTAQPKLKPVPALVESLLLRLVQSVALPLVLWLVQEVGGTLADLIFCARILSKVSPTCSV
jgi:hypothetical protein